MIPILVLDLETYYDRDYSLKQRKFTVPSYITHPKFRLHGIAVRYPDGRTEFRSDTASLIQELQAAYGQNLERVLVVCHNAYFDLMVLFHHDKLVVKHVIDTLFLHHHVYGRKGEGGDGAAGDLESIARKLGLQAKGDLSFMRGVVEPNGSQLAELRLYATNDVEITYQVLLKLLEQVQQPRRELPIVNQTVRLGAYTRLRIDGEELALYKIKLLGVTDRALDAAGVTRDDLKTPSDLRERLEPLLREHGETCPTKEGKKGPIPAFAKGDPALQGLLTHKDPRVVNLVAAYQAIKSEKYALVQIQKIDELSRLVGGIPAYLVYHGTGTGRFAGGGGLNLQNFAKRGIGAGLRKAIVPQPNNVFVSGDFAQIECRVLAWIADDRRLLQAFAEGRDVYSEFIQDALKRETRKPRPDDPEELRQILNSRRQLGKTAVLGLGYGMGRMLFLNRLQIDPETDRLLKTGELLLRDVARVHMAYRTAYPGIPLFWQECEEAFRCAMRGLPSSAGRYIHFEPSGADVLMHLPSGRHIRYRKPRLENSPAKETKYMDDEGEIITIVRPEKEQIIVGKDHLYGGKLVENACQAIARDVLVDALLAAETAVPHAKLCLHIHDEVIFEAPQQDASVAEAEVLTLLQTVPSWANGMPLKAEVKIASSLAGD